MKFHIILLMGVVCFIGCDANDKRFVVSAVVRQLFEMLRNIIKNGNADKGIPVLDPYQFPEAEVHFPEGTLTINANISKGTIDGIGDFQLLRSDLVASELSMELDLNFPLLKLKSESYEMEGNIYQILPLKGEGVMDIEITDLRFWAKIYLMQSEDGRSILIDKIEDSHFSVAKATSQTEFDHNIDEILNSMVQDLLAGYLTTFNQYIISLVSEGLLDRINPILNRFETWRFIAAIPTELNGK